MGKETYHFFLPIKTFLKSFEGNCNQRLICHTSCCGSDDAIRPLSTDMGAKGLCRVPIVGPRLKVWTRDQRWKIVLKKALQKGSDAGQSSRK